MHRPWEVPTSRSLECWCCREAKTVRGPGYSRIPRSFDPDILVDTNPARSDHAVARRFCGGPTGAVRPSRPQRAHPGCVERTADDHDHLFERNLPAEIDPGLWSSADQLVGAAGCSRNGLNFAGGTNWMRGWVLPRQFQQRQRAAGGLHPRLRAPSASANSSRPNDFSRTAAAALFLLQQPVGSEATIRCCWASIPTVLMWQHRSPGALDQDFTMASLTAMTLRSGLWAKNSE